MAPTQSIPLRKRLNGIDAFAGVGGMSLGLRDWMRTVAFVEIDENSQRIIRNLQMKGELEADAKIFGDVTGCNPKSMNLRPEDVDIITGGFPCQDLSVCGKQGGLKAKRSGLFYQLLRLADEFKPKFLYMENVQNLAKNGLDECVKELNKHGYDVKWTLISASTLGAPHCRRRMYILACRRGGRKKASATKATDSRYKHKASKFSISSFCQSALKRKAVLKPHLKAKNVKSGTKVQDSVLKSWSAEPTMDRMKVFQQSDFHKGLNRKTVDDQAIRCAALGNAIVPACARAAFSYMILGPHAGRSSGTSASSSGPVTTRWMRWNEQVDAGMAEAARHGFQASFRKSAQEALASGKETGFSEGLAQPVFCGDDWTEPKNKAGVYAGMVINGERTNLLPLTVLVEADEDCACVPSKGIVLKGNSRVSDNPQQTCKLVKKTVLKRWATPRYKGWGSCTVLTSRAVADLQTQLTFAEDQEKTGTLDLVRKGYPNPEFVEFMMGFPAGWTELAPPVKKTNPALEKFNNAVRRLEKRANSMRMVMT